MRLYISMNHEFALSPVNVLYSVIVCEEDELKYSTCQVSRIPVSRKPPHLISHPKHKSFPYQLLLHLSSITISSQRTMAKPLTTRILALPAPCIRPIAIRPLAALVPKSTIHFSPLSPTSTSSPHRHFSRHAPSSNWALWPRKEPAKWYFGETPRSWTVEEVRHL